MFNVIANSAINIGALLILSRMICGNHILASQRKRPFFWGIVLTITVILAEVGTLIASDSGSSMRSLNLVSNVFGFMLTPFIPVVLLEIFDRKVLYKRLYLLVPAMLNGIAAVLSPKFGLLFRIDTDNRYSRGNLFFLFVTVYLIHLLLLVFVTLRKRHGHLRSISWSLFGLTLFVVAGTCIQIVFPQVYASWHCVTLSLFLFYILLSEYDGRFDQLTGLFNRSAFEKDISLLNNRTRFSVIVMDINDFKIINDTYGHEYGDAVLKKVAAIIRESFDQDCSSYRIGGDEFYVLCKNCDQEKLDHQLHGLTSRLSYERKNNSHLPTVAYGRSISQTEMTDIQVMLNAADDEMYAFKQLQKERESADAAGIVNRK